MSIQPPGGDPPTAAPARQQPPDGTLRCPRCSAPVGPEQGWCLECGAPARTRLAQTPNWQLPTAALGALLLVAGALFAFAFVKLTDDGGGSASTAPAPATAPPPAVAPPAVTPPLTTPPATTPPTAGAAPPADQTTPPATAAPPSTAAPGATTATTPGATAPIPP